MSTTLMHGSLSEIRDHWVYWLSMGGILVALGLLCLIVPVAATLATMVVLGASLIVAGVAQIAMSFRDKWVGVLLYVPVGLLEAAVGAYLLFQPAEGAVAVTVLIAFYLIVVGILRSAMAIAGSFDGWGWMLAAGIVTLGLGVLVYTALPLSGFWFAGVCVGVSLLSQGLATIAVAVEAHRSTGSGMHAA